MSPFIYAIIWVFFSALLWWYLSSVVRHRKHGHKLPPGPRGLPIIGFLHTLGTFPHRALHELAKKYGPIMYLKLGSVPTIVISTPELAKLFLKTHDSVFASRPKIQASEKFSYGTKGIAFTEYGPYWRSVRKLCTLELLSVRKVDSFTQMRREEVRSTVNSIREDVFSHRLVNVSEKIEELIENMTYRMLFGQGKGDRTLELKSIIQEAVYMFGAFNVADFVPLLAPLDLQGFNRRMKIMRKALDKILETIITEHEQDVISGQKNNDGDFIDVLLSILNRYFSTHDELYDAVDRTSIKGIIFDLTTGALETSTTAIEWTLTELIRNPRVMKQLQEELNSVIGNKRLVEETDLPKLEYLMLVVKESLRLHPVAPLLVPRESIEDIVINGYYIPKRSRVLVNYWAIANDPSIWSHNVEEFIPERFFNSSIGLKGQDFELIPFGSGRRGCPGLNLGLLNIRLVVAQFVHCFDWDLGFGTSPTELDMTETFGLSLTKAKPLLAVPNNRLQI